MPGPRGSPESAQHALSGEVTFKIGGEVTTGELQTRRAATGYMRVCVTPGRKSQSAWLLLVLLQRRHGRASVGAGDRLQGAPRRSPHCAER
jgi:hypothetical protein